MTWITRRLIVAWTVGCIGCASDATFGVWFGGCTLTHILLQITLLDQFFDIRPELVVIVRGIPMIMLIIAKLTHDVSLRGHLMEMEDPSVRFPPSAQNMRLEVHLWVSNQELHRPTRSRRIKGWSILPLFLSLLRWGLELLLFLFLIIAKSSDSLFLLWVLNLFDVHIPLFHCRQSIQHGWGSSEEGDSHLRTVNITGECRHHDVWVVVFHLETLRVEPLKLRLEGLAFPLYDPN